MDIPRSATSNDPTQATIAHLSQTPWCAALLADPAWTPAQTWSRVAKPRSGGAEDSFVAETLGTARTIRRCLTLRPTTQEDIPEGVDAPAYREVRTVMELGEGLNGHPRICHGGFVATMLDEVTGVLIQFNLEMKVRRLKEEGRETGGLSCFTAYLNVNYKKPVPTPGVVLCRARFDRQERNKIYCTGTIEDGEGTVYSSAEGMFVEVMRTSAHL